MEGWQRMAERFNEESNPMFNSRESGLVIVPGSNYANEMEKFEQFPSRYGGSPGNPYQYRPFPKMLYRAEFWKGKAVCMAAPPDPLEYPNPSEFQRVEEAARRFSESCQLIVKGEVEYQRAMENGYRESPDEAVSYLLSRRAAQGQAAAERAYADRGMSEAAQAEAKAASVEHFDNEGEHLAAVPEKRRRGRPRKVVAEQP